MGQDDSPASVLAALGKRYRNEALPTAQEIETLLKLCETASGNLREAALSLLLHPPVSHEGTYHQWLTSYLIANKKRAGRLPLPLLELLLDRVALTGKMPEDREQRQFFRDLPRNLPRYALHQLFEKRFPLQPFLRHIPPRGLVAGHLKGCNALKRRWRLLKTRLNALPESPAWSLITLKDLQNLRKMRRSGNRRVLTQGAWLIQGRPLLFPPRRSVPANSIFTMPSSFWGGSGCAALMAFETLLHGQAEELRRIRTLARDVSRHTGRVVLSWHNATLAASGGWAFEGFRHYFPTDSLFKSFQGEVYRERQKLGERTGCPEEKALQGLWTLWEKRIVHPRILHACWESRVCATLDHSFREDWERDAAEARSFLGAQVFQEMAGGERFSSHGAVSPHQRMSLQAIRAWRNERQTHWQRGLHHLVALLRQGQKLMNAGQLECLVLPWIEKFFISSRREEDREFLPALVGWLESLNIHPLILFWEDTAHASIPSFQLALQRLQERGCAFRGIGIFDSEDSRRQDAEEIIRREHGHMRLFALRPHSDTYHRHSLSELLQGSAAHFRETYDSSWKDDLCFLYAGTQVAPLLSVQCEMEPFAPWLAFQGLKYPFGSYFRQRLRREVLKAKAHVEMPLSTEYFAWANLC